MTKNKMATEITEKIGAILLKKTLNASGRNIAITGMHAGQAPSNMPVSDPANPVCALSTEQRVATFLL